MKNHTIYNKLLLVLFLCGVFFSCAKDNVDSQGYNSSDSGLIQLSIRVANSEERVPTRTDVPPVGSDEERAIVTLHIFVFDATTGVRETREVISLSSDGTSAWDDIAGTRHPMWNGDTQKLRLTIAPGQKNICVIANWPTNTTASDGCEVLRDITTYGALEAVVRTHNATVGNLLNPPVMCGLKHVRLTGSEQELEVDLERQIARVDLYPAISLALQAAGAKVKIEGVKFRKIAGASFLTPHKENDGITPKSPATAASSLWAMPDYDSTSSMADFIDVTNPSAAGIDKRFDVYYLPEYIAADAASATEMVIKATYGGATYYYAVKLHNGLSDADKHYWIERNHWYRYNITITGRGSVDENSPNFTNIQVGIRDNDWEGGESTTPDVGFDLPLDAITVMHVKGMSRFKLGTSKSYGVGSDVDWITARRIIEGNGVNARTYLEIMTRTNTGGDRVGTVTIMLPNGLTRIVTVTQLSEVNSTWTNPTDGSVWYKANVGAARIEDPGFFYQWGINKTYSAYTPVAGVVPSATDPLVSYGAVDWSDTPQVFPLTTPVTTWNTTAVTDVEWSRSNDPCPSGYAIPAKEQLDALTNGTHFATSNPGWSMINGINGMWFNGTNSPSVGTGFFMPGAEMRMDDTGKFQLLDIGIYFASTSTALAANSGLASGLVMQPMSVSVGDGLERNRGYSIRCVKMGNVRYDGNGHTSGVVPRDNARYASGATVMGQHPGTMEKANQIFSGWEVISSTGAVIVADLAIGGTFNYPASAEYVTIKAKWSYMITYDGNAAGVIGNTNLQIYLHGETKPLSANGFYRPGYAFVGWSVTPGEGGTIDYANQYNFTAIASVTFYARWRIVTYNITYTNLQGATPPASATSYDIETPTFATRAPGARVTHRFAGWWTNLNAGTEVPQIVQGSTGDKVLYARWIEKEAIVTPSGNIHIGKDRLGGSYTWAWYMGYDSYADVTRIGTTAMGPNTTGCATYTEPGAVIDPSVYGPWRLPTVAEMTPILQGLIDAGPANSWLGGMPINTWFLYTSEEYDNTNAKVVFVQRLAGNVWLLAPGNGPSRPKDFRSQSPTSTVCVRDILTTSYPD